MKSLLLFMGFINKRFTCRIIRRDIDKMEIEANGMQVVIDDQAAEQGIRQAEQKRLHDCHPTDYPDV